MPLPCVRFTVRRMMVAVAIMGLTLGAWAFFRRRAETFDKVSQSHFDRYNALHNHPPVGPELSEAEVGRIEARIRWHANLSKKYALASESPWLPVTPDPPEPE